MLNFLLVSSSLDRLVLFHKLTVDKLQNVFHHVRSVIYTLFICRPRIQSKRIQSKLRR